MPRVPRVHYQTGYKAENEAVHILKNARYRVMRSAGSKGSFDLFAYTEKEGRLIEVKVVPHGSNYTFKRLKGELMKVGVPEGISKEIWVREKRGGWVHHFVDQI